MTGYFLRAKLIFGLKISSNKSEDIITSIYKTISNHAQFLQESPWSGLPELTNQNGEECPDSCQVQAWTMATILDLLYDLSFM